MNKKSPSQGFIRRMRALRKTRNMTQGDLADRLTDRGISTHLVTISKIESGTRGITLDEAVAISDALGVPLNEMVMAEPVKATITITTTVEI